MPSLQEIKERIGSVSTTKKITKAMQLVATAKLRSAKGHLDGIQEYYHSVYDTFQELLNSIKDLSSIIPKPKNEKTLYILISSDIGLCGSYNSNVFKLLRKNIKTNDELVVIGNKGIASFRKDKRAIETYPNIGDEPNYAVASKMTELAVAKYLTGELSSIKLVHTEFINSVTFNAKITKILPVDKNENAKKTETLVEFEPTPEEVIRNSLPLYVSAIIFGATVESKVSEMSSRRTAMESASDNADELISKLNLEYNRARQAAITQEISEIVAGAEGN